MSQEAKKKVKKYQITAFQVYLIVELVIIYLSIVIPHEIILSIHRDYGCGHHSGGIDGDLWEWGRALGFTSLIWFAISSFQGFLMNKHAKLFHKKSKARDLHCFSSFVCIFFVLVHVYFLYISEP
ncbi:MAG: hypothetical protein EU539_05240, partial [Promethearchaeota archaeon]